MLLFLLFPFFSFASDCPQGYALSKGADFNVQIVDSKAKYGVRNCAVKGSSLAGMPLKVVGCYPDKAEPGLLFLQTPDPWKNSCFQSPQKVIRVFADQFTVKKNPSEFSAEPAADCPEPEITTLDPMAAGDIRSITTIIESREGELNGFKTVDQLDKYHSCLLSGKSKQAQQEKYEDKYRYVIEKATKSLGVPMALLTCLCGRESMFKASATSSTSVTGICQNTSANLSDVQKWISRKGSNLQRQWKNFLGEIGDRLEHSDCKNGKLTPDLVNRCPALGFGAAAVYLKYAYSRIEGTGNIGQLSWNATSLEALVTMAAAYNVGVGRGLNLKKLSQKKWEKAILAETCKKDGNGKFEELKGHIVALRSCLLADNWLDHQGKPLGGECREYNTPEALKRQKAKLAKFEASLPSCKK